MLATATLEMIPESVKLREERSSIFFGSADMVFAFVPSRYFLVHFFEHTVAPHFHFGLIIRTFFDRVAIASGLLVSTWLGGAIFVAIFLHKIPEGFTISSLMPASRQGRRIALASAAILGGATLAGITNSNSAVVP
jgi:zinc and cadmium transporter